MPEVNIPQKRCAKCKELLPATPEYFRRASKEKDGLKSSCKSCLKKQDELWREKNPTRQSDWYQDNRDRILGKSKDWYKNNSDKKHNYDKQYRIDNVDKLKEKNKKQYLDMKNDPEKYNKELLRKKKFKITHADQVKISNRERDRRFPEKARAKTHKRLALKAQAPGAYTDADIKKLYESQQGKCAYCGCDISWAVKRQVHIDHVQPLSKGGSNWPDNLALACMRCNCSKADWTLEEWTARRGW